MLELFSVAFVLALLALPIWAIVRIVALGKDNDRLSRRVQDIELELDRLRRRSHPPAGASGVAPLPQPVSSVGTAGPAVRSESPIPTDTSSVVSLPPTIVSSPVVTAPPPVLFEVGTAGSAVLPPTTPRPLPAIETTPPVRTAPTEPPLIPPPPAQPRIVDWEHFTGAKLFAWIGGFAAFLAAAFFVKYSFEHNLIPPAVRVAIGFAFGLGLIAGGLKISRQRFAITAETLVATGVVVLYAVTFACHSYYRFPAFTPLVAFAVMSLITAGAFALAVRLDAKVIAILGILGGFLTPALLSTGRDNTLGLFGYVALLDAGLIAVALRRRWHFLVPLGVAGTVLMQLAWGAKFFAAHRATTAMSISLVFCGLFLGAYFAARAMRRATDSAPEEDADSAGVPMVAPEIVWSAIAMPFIAFAWAFILLNVPSIAVRPGQWFLFVLAADAVLLLLAWFDEPLPKLHLGGGLGAFGLLAGWMTTWLTPPLLGWALGSTLVFAVVHTAFPLLLDRKRGAAAPDPVGQLFPPLALLLLLVPLFKLETISLAYWPCVLALDAVAIAAAAITGSAIAVLAVLVLTAVATGAWMFGATTTISAGPLLVVIAGFAVVFFAATALLGRRDKIRALGESDGLFGDQRSQLPAISALLPFALLVLANQQLLTLSASALFGAALGLAALTLGLAAAMSLPWLPLCALVGVVGVEYAWHARHFDPHAAGIPLGWYGLFIAIFAGYPFLFRRRFAQTTGPWAVAALASVAHFPLVHRLIKTAWPNEVMGLVPALFAIAPLASAFVVRRLSSAGERARLDQIAWFAGVGLLFITLIVPVQFDRQWVTIGWALEGAALLWLFHRVPHPGLKGVGVVLLIVAFARLALNPAVLEYHARSETPLLNWYLYAYGLVTVALFVGMRLVAPPRHEVAGINVPPLLATLGTVLAFLLLNIEIADYFSPPGTTVLTFQFSGNFARDMTYTIAWSVFALALLLVSLVKGLRPGRFAALALLGVAVLKLFFHDLSHLHSLYRIGALFAVAVVASLASFAYQRFLPREEK